MLHRLAITAAATAPATPAEAQAQVPIRAVVLPDGVSRCSAELTPGGPAASLAIERDDARCGPGTLVPLVGALDADARRSGAADR